jgi:cobalt-zinc-cadmium efflux system outer membrane protein
MFFASILALAGCARFEPKPISPAQTAAELESRSLTNAALKIFLEKNLHRDLTNWPAASWDFDMLTLATFYYHPDLAVARAQWNVAQAGVKTAGGRPNPTLSITPGYDTTHNAGLSPWFPAVNFDLPVETAGKRGHRIAVAGRLSESARLNIATVAWQVRSNLRASLIDFLAARQRVDLLQKQIGLQEQVIKLLNQQVEVGAISSFEATPFRITRAKTQLDFADAQRQLAESRVRVVEAIGVPASALGVPSRPLRDGNENSHDPSKEGTPTFSFELPTDFSAATNLTSAEIRHLALLSRSDILGALAEYAAAQATLRLEIAKQYPDIHLNPGYQFDQGDNKWSLGITFDLPILNQNQGPIAEAKARREEAAARFNALQAKVLAQIETAVEVFRVTEKNSEALQSLATEQAKRRDSVEAQFKAGAAEQLDFLNAQSEFALAELAQLDGRSKLQQAAAALEDAVQRPLSGEVSLAAIESNNSSDQPTSPAKKEKRK